MSTTEAAADDRCASCGIAAGDDDNIKLKKCGACGHVRYCSLQCQRNHRPQHKRACKKRAAELREELLFKQPESTHLGDCPICLLPMPFPTSQETMNSAVQSCCFKTVCDGCADANKLREIEARLPPTCPFCRTPLPDTDAEIKLNVMKRIKANDPAALHTSGMRCFNTGNYATAIEYWEKAVRLGDIESHYNLSGVYHEGRGVERDRKKFVYHLEEAAIGGHVFARENIGEWEELMGNIDRAVKHSIIAANLGHGASIERLKKYYARGVVSKEDVAAALRAHQAAVDAMKSPQRDAAKLARKRARGLGIDMT